jgi:hypothetical protein
MLPPAQSVRWYDGEKWNLSISATLRLDVFPPAYGSLHGPTTSYSTFIICLCIVFYLAELKLSVWLTN